MGTKEDAETTFRALVNNNAAAVPDAPVASAPNYKLMIAIAIAILLLLGVGAWWWFKRGKGKSATGSSSASTTSASSTARVSSRAAPNSK